MTTPVISQEELARLTHETFVSRVEHHTRIGSTNDRSLELAREPHLETPLVILADEQTAGRGRGANQWWSSEGALTYSLVVEPSLLDLPPETWPRVAIVVGLSLCELLTEIVPKAEVGLKWPNDVWLNGKKVAGILVEVPPANFSVPQRLVIGMGLNVNNSWEQAPEELRDKGIAICDVPGERLSPGEFLIRLLQRLEKNLETLANSPDDLVGCWQKYCALSGRTVEIRQGERVIRGRCLGIGTDGGLILEGSEGRQSVYGGIVTGIA